MEEYLNPDAEVEDVTVTLRKSLNELSESKESEVSCIQLNPVTYIILKSLLQVCDMLEYICITWKIPHTVCL